MQERYFCASGVVPKHPPCFSMHNLSTHTKPTRTSEDSSQELAFFYPLPCLAHLASPGLGVSPTDRPHLPRVSITSPVWYSEFPVCISPNKPHIPFSKNTSSTQKSEIPKKMMQMIVPSIPVHPPIIHTS